SGINEVLWSPIKLSAADVEHKVAQNLCAHARVAYFGMKLHGKHLLCGILNCSKRIGRLGYKRKAGRQLHCFVAMRHPDFQRFWQSAEELGFCNNLDLSVSILARLGGIHFSAEHVNHQLQSVTNPQNGHSEFKNAWVRVGSVGIVDGTRASGKNDPSRRVAADLI